MRASGRVGGRTRAGGGVGGQQDPSRGAGGGRQELRVGKGGGGGGRTRAGGRGGGRQELSVAAAGGLVSSGAPARLQKVLRPCKGSAVRPHLPRAVAQPRQPLGPVGDAVSARGRSPLSATVGTRAVCAGLRKASDA